MINLKVNKTIFLVILFVLGCSTSSFKVLPRKNNTEEIVITPDRVILECSDVGSDEGTFYGFSMHVLDHENTVLHVVQTNKLDKESCEKRITKIGKILSQGHSIHIVGVGDLHEPEEKEETTYAFKGLGIHPGNGRVLQFMYVLNENGGCYDAYSADKKPCPQN
jgi:hypothetical protein